MASVLCVVQANGFCAYIALNPGDRVFCVQSDGHPIIPPMALFEAPDRVMTRLRRIASTAPAPAASPSATPPPFTPSASPPPPPTVEPPPPSAPCEVERAAAEQAPVPLAPRPEPEPSDDGDDDTEPERVRTWKLRRAFLSLRSFARRQRGRLEHAEAIVRAKRSARVLTTMRRVAFLAQRRREEQEQAADAFRSRRVKERVMGAMRAARALALAKLEKAKRHHVHKLFAALRDVTHRQHLATELRVKSLRDTRFSAQARLRSAFVRWRAAKAERALVSELPGDTGATVRRSLLRRALKTLRGKAQERGTRIADETFPILLMFCVSRYFLCQMYETLEQHMQELTPSGREAARFTHELCKLFASATHYREPSSDYLRDKEREVDYGRAVDPLWDVIVRRVVDTGRFKISNTRFLAEDSVFIQIPMLMTLAFTIMMASIDRVHRILLREFGAERGPARAKEALEHYACPVFTACSVAHTELLPLVRRIRRGPTIQHNNLEIVMRVLYDLGRVRSNAMYDQVHGHALAAMMSNQNCRFTAPDTLVFRIETCLRISQIPPMPLETTNAEVISTVSSVLREALEGSNDTDRVTVRDRLRKRIAELRHKR